MRKILTNESWAGAIGALSVIIGGDLFGRRITVMLGQTIIIIGAVLQFSSYSLAQVSCNTTMEMQYWHADNGFWSWSSAE